jgi:FkbM family methyltransferase
MNEFFKKLFFELTTSKLSDVQLRDLAFAGRLRRLFDEHRIDTVFDVGANAGQFRDFLRKKVGFKGQIESFEPVPDLATQLMTRAENDAHWKIHACALGAETGQKAINVTANTVFSSFRKPIATGSHQDQMNKVEKTVLVPIATIDTMFNKETSAGYISSLTRKVMISRS